MRRLIAEISAGGQAHEHLIVLPVEDLISAAAVFVSLPLVLIVMIMQKRIVSGLITGGVKG